MMLTWMVAMALLFQTPRYKVVFILLLKKKWKKINKKKWLWKEKKKSKEINTPWTSLVLQSLRLPAVTTAGTGLTPGWRTKILHTMWSSICWTPLVVKWLRIHLPMQGTWVQSLVREDSTCHWAAKPVCPSCWAPVLQLLKSVRMDLCSALRGHCREKPAHCS